MIIYIFSYKDWIKIISDTTKIQKLRIMMNLVHRQVKSGRVSQCRQFNLLVFFSFASTKTELCVLKFHLQPYGITHNSTWHWKIWHLSCFSSIYPAKTVGFFFLWKLTGSVWAKPRQQQQWSHTLSSISAKPHHLHTVKCHQLEYLRSKAPDVEMLSGFV